MMGRGLLALVLYLGYSLAESSYYEDLAAHVDAKKYEPMVAFQCGRPAMHRTESGWEPDTTTDCLNEAVDILEYCKKKYPDEDVRNIVESSEMYSITNWCPNGHKHCKHGPEQTVRPYRCLVGEFQSDALLVPPHCNFSHEHNAKRCMDFFEWSATATEKCQERGLHLQSFAMLQPCGLKVFTGVEFVCCPTANNQEKPVPVTVAKKAVKVDETKTKQKAKAHDKPKKKKEDAYEAYLHYGDDGVHNEHQRFRAAIKVLQQDHHQKISNMMKDWAAARKHVNDLRATDPKSAETLNKDLTERFQKMYQALEQDGAARKRQLVAIHQQRIQAKLNLKKRTAMETYLRALENEEPTDIMKALEHYIRAEEKDRIHTINHFEHVREVDSEDSERILPQTKEHLKVIDQRINQSMEMLQRVPRFKDKIALQIREFMKNYRSVDESIKHVIDAASKEQTKSETKPEIIKPEDHKPEMTVPITEDDTEIAKELGKTKPKEKIDDGGLYGEKKVIEVKPLKPDDEKEKKTQPKKKEYKKKQQLKQKLAQKKKKKEHFDPETTENEHAFWGSHEAPVPKPAHHVDNSLSVQKTHVADVHQATPGSMFGIAIGSVAVFVIIIVAIVVMRRKAQRTPTTTGFVEVEHPASPEEKHVANMQMNGYENPTYKYFEKATPNQC